MARTNIVDSDGHTLSEDDPGFDRVRIDNLETDVAELRQAVIDLQNRVSRLDGEDLQWPADNVEPMHTHPFEGTGRVDVLAHDVSGDIDRLEARLTALEQQRD